MNLAVVWNGKPKEWFGSTHAIRQGDPLPLFCFSSS